MPISREWIVPDRVLYIRSEGNIIGELAQHDQKVLALLDAAPDIVHSISDLRDVTTHARLKESMTLKSMLHPKCGWMITVGATQNPVLRMLVSMTLWVVKTRHRDASSLEQAFTILQVKDPTLQDLKSLFAKAQLDKAAFDELP